LEVQSWAWGKRLRQDKHTAASDEEIREAIEDAFLYDPRVNASNPQLKVENGTVTLSGTVDDLVAKRAAAKDAGNVVGVLRVKNHLRVRPPVPITDQEIEQYVRNSMRLDPYLDNLDLKTAAVNGRVHLWGEVDSSFQRARAEYLAAQVPGVIEVEIHLRVKEGAPEGLTFPDSDDPWWPW
jgi:osmotically-inducible protein OsmY